MWAELRASLVTLLFLRGFITLLQLSYACNQTSLVFALIEKLKKYKTRQFLLASIRLLYTHVYRVTGKNAGKLLCNALIYEGNGSATVLDVSF